MLDEATSHLDVERERAVNQAPARNAHDAHRHCTSAGDHSRIGAGGLACKRRDRGGRTAATCITADLIPGTRTWMHYSMTSSARNRNNSGIVRPSALAALRLMASSNFTGSCTGRSLACSYGGYAWPVGYRKGHLAQRAPIPYFSHIEFSAGRLGLAATSAPD